MRSDEERRDIVLSISTRIVDNFISFAYNKSKYHNTDKVQEYAIQLLSLECFYSCFSDAIKEGDGGRIFKLLEVFITHILEQ